MCQSHCPLGLDRLVSLLLSDRDYQFRYFQNGQCGSLAVGVGLLIILSAVLGAAAGTRGTTGKGQLDIMMALLQGNDTALAAELLALLGQAEEWEALGQLWSRAQTGVG